MYVYLYIYICMSLYVIWYIYQDSPNYVVPNFAISAGVTTLKTQHKYTMNKTEIIPNSIASSFVAAVP